MPWPEYKKKRRETPSHMTVGLGECIQNLIAVMSVNGQVFGHFAASQVVPTDEDGEQTGDAYGDIPIEAVKQLRVFVTDISDNCNFPGALADSGLDYANSLRRLVETHPTG